MEKAKLIWDFRGTYGKNTAIHYEKHLREFLKLKKITLIKSGLETINVLHHLAYIIILKENLDKVKPVLKPNRVEILN